MDVAIIKEIAALPPLAVLIVVIFLQQKQIEKLIDSIIRMQDAYTRTIACIVPGAGVLLSNTVRSIESETPHVGP